MSYGNQAPAYAGVRQYYEAQQVSHLIGRQVRVNRGGPDSIEGVLVASPGDYLVVLSDDTIVYVNALHVKSITEGGSASRGRSGGGKSGGKSGSSSSRSGMRSRHRSFISASSFHSVLTRLRHHHVQVNRGGPEKLDGFLAEIAADNVLLIVDRELVRIPTFHIKNVSISTTGSNNNKNQSGSNKNQSGGNKNKSGKNNKRSGKGKGKG